MNKTSKPHRPVRSFVRREGRLTTGQQRALDELLPRCELKPVSDTAIDFSAAFGRDAFRTLEIGFGDGQVLAAMAAEHPERDYVGIEVHRPGVGRLLMALEKSGAENVRVIVDDAALVLRHHVTPASFDAINIFFPDPWPKKRHHKRRLVTPAFVELLTSLLKPGGSLHIATDWAPYAEEIEVMLRNAAGLTETSEQQRPETKFERRGLKLGHDVFDFVYERA